MEIAYLVHNSPLVVENKFDHLSMSYCNRFGLKQKHGHFGSVLFVHYSNDIGLRLTVRTATLPLETCWGDFHEIVSDRRCDTRLSGARPLGPGIGRAETRPFSCYLIALFQVHFRVSCPHHPPTLYT